jgi:hypothetical protein
MGRLFRGLIFVGIAAGLALSALRRFGLLSSGECSPACECSRGEQDCACGHRTCLSPATG